MKNRVRFAAVLTLACGAAMPAAAQCNLYRYGVPDFDQKRDALPNDGNMYCVPTSAVNWTAYIANHGWPLMMSGPRNWQAQANYNFVTSTDATMGVLMSTSATGGTTGGNGLSGLQSYLFAHGFGLFNATVWYGNITPQFMYFQMQTNGLVNICYGYYKENTGIGGLKYYTRDGGHCVTLNGLEDVCTSTPTVWLRNPADDSSINSQSIFSTVTSRAISQSFNAEPTGIFDKTRTRLADFGVDSTTRRYVDTMYVIRSAFCCWGPASTTKIIKINKAIHLFGDLQAQTADIELPDGDLVKLALHPDMAQLAYIRKRTLVTGAMEFRLSLVNLADGTQRDLMPVSPAAAMKTPMAFSRFGELYICDGSVLKAYDVSGREPAMTHSRELASPACSMAFDDVKNELVVLTPGNRRLIRCSMDLETVIDEPLPTGVPEMGDGSVLPDPATGRYLVIANDAPEVHELGLIPGTPRLQHLNGLLLPAVQKVREAAQGDGGTFFLLGDGSVHVLDRDPKTRALRVSPNKLFDDLPPMNFMSMSRSRTNFNPEEHDGPDWRNLPPEELDEGVASVPDCGADFNHVNGVTVQDTFDFLTAWLDGSPAADFNTINGVTVQDIFDFLTAWLAGCD